MNHEQAFLQAIREAPHDDAPRLIYADWLEEQGGAARAARANFIRIQCRLDEMPDDDPARDPLEDEAADLLAEHENEWTQPLHGIAEDWRFHRGFVEHIRIRGENLLTNAERLFDFAPLRSLHLLIYRNSVPGLAACPQLRLISSLDFSRCQLNDRSLQQLLTSPHLDRLSDLNLDGNDIDTPGIQALVHSHAWTRLRSLDLSHYHGSGDKAIRLLAHAAEAASLESLSVTGTNLTLEGLHELLCSSSLGRLTKLNLSDVRWSVANQTFALRRLREPPLLRQLQLLDLSRNSIGILRELLNSPDLANLRILNLSSINLGSRDGSWLTLCPGLANLTHLDLVGNKLGAVGIHELAEFPNLVCLTHLNVRSNNIRDSGAKSLAASPYLKRLRVLNLSSNGIGGPGMKALAESANLDHLRTLGLGSNYIGADSVRVLAESAHLHNLTCLDLSDASLEEDSARVLASSANLGRLRTLLLKKNLLGDGGVKALAQSPHLTRLSTLDLNDNRIGKAGAEALAAASWRQMRSLDLRGNVFTDTQETLLRQRFGNAVQL